MMKIYFVGAGPGASDLITVKGRDLLKKAQIVIYAGSLVNEELLKWVPKKSIIYNSAGMTFDEVCRVYEKGKEQKIKIIVRLHTGDPSIYGAVQEQIDWCRKIGYDYEVVPGVSSFCAASASLEQELTLPGISQTIIISRISGRTKVPEKESLEKLAKIEASLVLFLSVDKIKDAVKKLKISYEDDTPVKVVSRASWLDEKIVEGRLDDIAKKVSEAKITRQALIFVGNVLRKKGYNKSRLYDKSFTHDFRKAK